MIEKSLLEKWYIENNMTLDELSDKLNVSSRTIRRWLAYYNIEKPKSLIRRCDTSCPFSKEELENKFNEIGAKSIADDLGCNVKTVYRWLKANNILVNVQKKYDTLNEEQIVNDYVELNKSINDIRNEYKISFQKLKDIFTNHNVKVKHTYEVDENEFYQYYIVENHSREETIEHFKISGTFFRNYIVKKGFKKNKCANKQTKTSATKEEIYHYYIMENHTAEDSANHFGIGLYTFMNLLTKYNIKKTNEARLNNMYQTNMEKYGAKTKFGTSEFKEWRKENIDTIMENMQNTFMEKYGVKSFVESKEAMDVWKMGTSKTEQEMFESLKNVFPNTINHYKSELYPFNCDFYIPEIDTYIEYQGFYTHGTEPFDKNNEKHIAEVEKLLDNKTEHNIDKLYIWCKHDPEKREIARKNNLNWIEFFTQDEFNKWLDEQRG